MGLNRPELVSQEQSPQQDKPPAREPVRCIPYFYCEPDGTPVAVHVRREYPDGRKDFTWQLPDRTPGLGGLSVPALPLYRVERLTPGLQYVVVVDRLWSVGIPAVGVPGADVTPDDDRLRQVLELAGTRVVYLWPDNDESGRELMTRVGKRFRTMGAKTYWVNWKEAPPKGDAADAIQAGVDVQALLAQAVPVGINVPLAQAKAGLEEANRDGWIVEGFLRPGWLAVLAAEPKTGKSLLADNLTVALARGEPFLGLTTRQTAVLRIDLERYRLTVERLARLAGDSDLPYVFLVKERIMADDTDEILGRIRQAQADAGLPVLVIIDPLGDFIWPAVERRGGSLNDYASVGAILQSLRGLAEETQAAFLLIHHLRKAQVDSPRPRDVLGSVNISGKVDVVAYLRKAGDVLTLEARGNDIEPLTLHYAIQDDLRAVPCGAPLPEAVQRVAEVLKAAGMVTAEEIAVRAGLSPSRVRVLLARLAEKGHAVRVERNAHGKTVWAWHDPPITWSEMQELRRKEGDRPGPITYRSARSARSARSPRSPAR